MIATTPPRMTVRMPMPETKPEGGFGVHLTASETTFCALFARNVRLRHGMARFQPVGCAGLVLRGTAGPRSAQPRVRS